MPRIFWTHPFFQGKEWLDRLPAQVESASNRRITFYLVTDEFKNVVGIFANIDIFWRFFIKKKVHILSDKTSEQTFLPKGEAGKKWINFVIFSSKKRSTCSVGKLLNKVSCLRVKQQKTVKKSDHMALPCDHYFAIIGWLVSPMGNVVPPTDCPM